MVLICNDIPNMESFELACKQAVTASGPIKQEVCFKNLIRSHFLAVKASTSDIRSISTVCAELKSAYARTGSSPSQLYYALPGYYGPYLSLDAANMASGLLAGYASESVLQSHIDYIPILMQRLRVGIVPESQRETSVLSWFKLLEAKLSKTVSVIEFGGGYGIAAAILARNYPNITFEYTIVDQLWLVELLNEANLPWPRNLRIKHIHCDVSQAIASTDIFFACAAIHYCDNFESTMRAWRMSSKYIVLDRLPVSERVCSFTVNQVTSKSSYNTIYSSWCFSRSALLEAFDCFSMDDFLMYWQQPEDHLAIFSVESGDLFDSFLLSGIVYECP